MADKDDSSDEFGSSSEEESPAPKSGNSGNNAGKDDEEDEFAFGNDSGGGQKAAPKVYKDQHFDEAMAVSEDEESVDDSSMSYDQPAAKQAAPAQKKSEFDDDDDDDEEGDSSEESDEDSDDNASSAAKKAPAPVAASNKEDDDESSSEEGSSEEDDDDEDDDDDDSAGGGAAKMSAASAYNPADYANLKVSSEIQGLFDYISRHKPTEIELDTKLKPFIPDFIPAVGEIDAFLKVPRPDGKADGLGLTVLDEPAVNQSDPTVLDIKIRVMSKHSGVKPMTVRSIDSADKYPKKISSWISNIEDVHRKKPPPSVNYSKNMPDIETLMQVWPSELEDLFKVVPLPEAELDMDIADFVRVVCAILDIPVYDKLTESLHVLFTLYTEFKTNSHFQAIN